MGEKNLKDDYSSTLRNYLPSMYNSPWYKKNGGFRKNCGWDLKW